ncbi:Transposase and inactivated derivatives [Hahella chejuensis KCTC 2396]|uniref:Transposase and inactivated derivatives n=1 Tax=Hahella chejuensis (strain KCTC 2396) TaxID=349521 RepID=Q2SJJ7_HAHCH|nr:Transposase and inactivated derivatives [Hahella chejuensis KCTC 2396]
MAISTADVTDRKGVLQALERCKPVLNRVQSLLCDSGYTGEPFAQGVRDILGEHAQALDRRAQLCLPRQKSAAVVEKLRALA